MTRANPWANEKEAAAMMQRLRIAEQEKRRGTIVTVPIPPSVNNLFATMRGRRFKSRRYRQWIETAGWELLAQHARPVHGPYRVFISLPRTRADIDNLVKPILDLLVTHSLTDDDKNCRGVHVEVLPEINAQFAVVSIQPVGGIP